jgi:hypothetical protein
LLRAYWYRRCYPAYAAVLLGPLPLAIVYTHKDAESCEPLMMPYFARGVSAAVAYRRPRIAADTIAAICSILVV